MALDSNNLLSYSYWLGLSTTTRQKIADLFGFKKTVSGEVVDQRVVCDGFAHSSLAVITKERMQEITGVQSDDYYVLFNALVEVVEGKTPVENNTIQATNVQQEEQTTEVRPDTEKKRGRKAKGGE